MCKVDKFFLLGQEVFSRNNIQFPAAKDYQPLADSTSIEMYQPASFPLPMICPKLAPFSTLQNYQATLVQRLCICCSLLTLVGSHTLIFLLHRGTTKATRICAHPPVAPQELYQGKSSSLHRNHHLGGAQKRTLPRQYSTLEEVFI